MKYVDSLSRSLNIFFVEDNPFESDLTVSQNRDPNIPSRTAPRIRRSQ